MAVKPVKIKPIKASEITDIKIAREAIAQVQRKPTPEDYAYLQEMQELLKKTLAR